MDPVAVAQIVGLVTVPIAIEGMAFTVTTVAAEVAEQPLPFVYVTVYEPAADTLMDCVVAPVDQRLPVACEDVSVTEPPEQNEVGPLAEIVGAVGLAFTVTIVAAEVVEQPLPFVYVTVYEPLAVTLIDCVVAPVDQRLPVACDDVKVTEPPVQNVVDPLAEIVGADGFALTVTTVAVEVAEQPLPFVYVTVYEPAAETLIDCVVAPVDQTFPVPCDEVKVTDPPAQKVVGPPAEITGALGFEFTVTTTGAEDAEHPPPLV